MKELVFSIPGLGGQPGKIEPPKGIPSGGLLKLSEIIQVAITLLFIFVVVLALFVIIYSGIQWIISASDKQKVEQARGRLTFAIVGLLIAFFSFLIINLLGHLFDLTLIQP